MGANVNAISWLDGNVLCRNGGEDLQPLLSPR
jgi:hypothetical protein